MMNHLFPFQYPTVCLHRLLYAFASHDTFSIWNRHRQKHVLPDFMKAGFKMIFGMISSHHPPPLSKDFFTVSVMYCQHIVCSKFPLPDTTNGPPSRTCTSPLMLYHVMRKLGIMFYMTKSTNQVYTKYHLRSIRV